VVRGMMLRWVAVAAEAGLVRVGVGASTAIGCMSRSPYGVLISCSSRRAVRGGDGGKHAGTLAATCCLARRRPSPSTPTQVLSVVPTAGVPPSMSWQLGLPAAAGTLPTVGLAAWTSAVLIKTTTIRAGFPVSRLSAAAALSTAFLSFGSSALAAALICFWECWPATGGSADALTPNSVTLAFCREHAQH